MEAYDEIIRIRDISLPEFYRQQDKAYYAISELLLKIPANTILDIGCGSGEILNKLALQFPNKKFVGIDVSKKSIDMAKNSSKNLLNVFFKHGSIIYAKPSTLQCKMWISVGNTLIHIGANNFRKILDKVSENASSPNHIFIDFINDWDKVVKKGNLFQTYNFKVENSSYQISGINTLRLGTRIIRELMTIKYKDNKQVETLVAPVKQYANLTEEYYAVLKDYRYVLTKTIVYEHGYGLMNGTLWVMKK